LKKIYFFIKSLFLNKGIHMSYLSNTLFALLCLFSAKIQISID
jgi:hypothetical protein